MNIDTGKQAPYAALAPVLALIRRRREKTLPEILNTEKLLQMSISEGNISRVLQALRFLGLIDEEGRQTERFARIARAKEQEYPDILAEIVKGAYHEVFTIIDDPNEATDIEINDAFRAYQPETQRSRMIILFRGLCQEAGLITGGPPETHMRSRPTTSGKSSPTLSNGARRAQPKSDKSFQPETLSQGQSQLDKQSMSSEEFVLVQGLLTKLPKGKKWTQRQRDKWIQALTANVDLLIDLIDSEDDL